MSQAVVINDEWVLSFLDQKNKWDSRGDAEEASRIIESTDVVNVLEFRGNTMGIEAGERIAEALKKHTELKRALWSDMFTGRMKSEIPPVLRSLCAAMMSSGVRLVELDLSDNAFGPIGAEGIEEFLQSPSAYSLKVLKLNNNGLGAGGKVIAKALSQCYFNAKQDGQNFCLCSFIAGRNRLEMPGAKALAEAFKLIGTLEEVNLHQNGITAEGIEALANSFKNNLHLRIINLSDNTFTTTGAKAVAKVLPLLRRLEALQFGDCLCRNSGTIALIESLDPAIHTRLKKIDLSGNELSFSAIEKVLNRMELGFQLESLVLHTNNLGGRFLLLKSRWVNCSYADLGAESDDQGSLDNDEDEEVQSEESGNEGDDENTEDAEGVEIVERGSIPAVTMEDIVLFIRKPTHEVLTELLRRQDSVISIIREELNAETHKLTSAFLYSLGSLASVSAANFQARVNVANFAEVVIKAAQSVKRWPLSTVDEILNTLLAYAVVTTTEGGEPFYGDVRGMIYLLNALLKRGYLKSYVCHLRCAFDGPIREAHPEARFDIDNFLSHLA